MADIILHIAETYIFTPFVWPKSFPLDAPIRQFLTLYFFTNIGAVIMYFCFSGFSYLFLFDKSHLSEKDKRVLPRQVHQEILYTLWSIPTMSFLTNIIFMLELKGCSRLYDDVSEYGWAYLYLTIPLFLLFTDMCIYFIHRGLHDIKFLYAFVHKPHHKWIITSPFASHSFHPVDGFLQGCPYHLFAFVFPMHKILYLFMFIVVQLWTVSIHDQNFVVPESLEYIINGAEHHTIHHTDFSYNYGQYFTIWDRMFGTHRLPHRDRKKTH